MGIKQMEQSWLVFPDALVLPGLLTSRSRLKFSMLSLRSVWGSEDYETSSSHAYLKLVGAFSQL